MTHNSRYVPVAVFAAVSSAAVFGLSCGGSTPAGPPTIPTTTTTTRPAPTPTPVGSCPLGQGTWEFECSRTRSRLLQNLEDAMEALIRERPQIFDLENEAAPGTRAYRVLDKDSYLSGLVAVLQTYGLCAQRDLDDPAQERIFVKDSQDFSEEFDVLLSGGHMRRGPGAYRTTCSPAAFPVERPVDAPPIGSGCYAPWPPEIQRMNCKQHLRGTEYFTLDSTPIVLDVGYCAHFGFPNADCPVRPEGWPDREACENYRVGTATDTGRTGPTWRKADGSFCTGPESGCQNSPDNQYQLFVYQSGTYTVCAKTGRCCSVEVVR